MFPFLAAVFLGAFLLFLVQPLMGRFVLPWQGGAPAVWTACLLFFQSALLLGYLYAHGLSQLRSLRRQLVVHLSLLVVALWWMPPLPHFPTPATAAEAASPLLQVLVMLARTIGPPFVLLAGSSPLLQRWFGDLWPQHSPYRLYALSNAGSLLALLIYPVLLEPWLARGPQTSLWAGLYAGFTALVAWIAWQALAVARTAPSFASPPAPASAEAAVPTWRQHLSWASWGALATALLAATTSALTLDVAAVPFLWIAPLGLYLVSLILCFDHPRWYRRGVWIFLLPVAMAASLDLRIFGTTLMLGQLLGTHLLALTVATMVCHGELYRARPASTHLTRFYLSLAAGGVAGTLLTAVLAPHLFNRDFDLPLLWVLLTARLILTLVRQRDLRLSRLWSAGLLFAVLAVPALRPQEHPSWSGLLDTWLALAANTAAQWIAMIGLLLLVHFRVNGRVTRTWSRRSAWGMIGLVGIIAWFVLGTSLQAPPGMVDSRRGFFGEITVLDYRADDPRSASRFLAHGSTTHGIELQHPDFLLYPTSYYSAESGIGRAFTRSNQQRHRRIGVIGLGVGTIASYGMTGDHLTFYEIDPHIVAMAREHFGFLTHTAAATDIRIGDGRRLIEAEVREADQPPYDLFVLDAFSSDSVPIHLLTREAFRTYLQRLTPQGVLAVNVSNRLVDLRPVLEGHARHFGLHFAHLINRPDPADWWDFSSEWILLSPARSALDDPAITSWTGIAAPDELDGIPWTDDFASLWSVLR